MLLQTFDCTGLPTFLVLQMLQSNEGLHAEQILILHK